jgi:hypothetical protein
VAQELYQGILKQETCLKLAEAAGVVEDLDLGYQAHGIVSYLFNQPGQAMSIAATCTCLCLAVLR